MIPRTREVPPGRLYGVGLGPGDPELITRKAARLIAAADVIAYHQGVGKSSNARRIAADLIPSNVIEEVLEYPVTTGATDHPGGYTGALADFYDECAECLAAHLDAGRTVVVLAEGDPMFYGSYMYVHEMLRDRYETEVVPGVPAFAAATAALAEPLVRQTEVLTVLPATLPEPELARRLADTDGAVIMKLGRTFPKVVSALRQAGRLDGAMYVERASMPEQRWLPVADVDPASVPYFSLIVVPGASAASGGLPLAALASDRSQLLVVGLGPGPDRWITPEVSAALAGVDHVVGYAPYVNRVPQRAGLQRHASGNTVEVERARFALELARKGERVAVVSGGDAGVFGMAAAVFEAAAEFPDVDIEVLPGVSAVQAVAAKAGAPIGADFAVVSLSDRLKPWSVLAQRLHAIGAADLVLAVYNPASRSRITQVAELQKILLEHRSPDTAVIVGRDIGRAEESLEVTTLAGLDSSGVDMKCMLIIGASSTHVTDTGRVWTPRFVEKENPDG
jgi:precorrin-2 C20-methyltransferase/precorrin-3B C17-methyltransferase